MNRSQLILKLAREQKECDTGKEILSASTETAINVGTVVHTSKVLADISNSPIKYNLIEDSMNKHKRDGGCVFKYHNK
jgi:hypothetical protein